MLRMGLPECMRPLRERFFDRGQVLDLLCVSMFWHRFNMTCKRPHYSQKYEHNMNLLGGKHVLHVFITTRHPKDFPKI